MRFQGMALGVHLLAFLMRLGKLARTICTAARTESRSLARYPICLRRSWSARGLSLHVHVSHEPCLRRASTAVAVQSVLLLVVLWRRAAFLMRGMTRLVMLTTGRRRSVLITM